VKELFTAIKTRFDSSTGATLRALCSSRMYVGRANQNVTGEYITLTNPAGATDHSISQGLSSSIGGSYENQTITFHVWTTSRSPSKAWTIVNAIKNLYDFQNLSLSSSYTMLHAQRTSPGVQIEQPAEKGWQVAVDYDYRIGRRK